MFTPFNCFDRDSSGRRGSSVSVDNLMFENMATNQRCGGRWAFRIGWPDEWPKCRLKLFQGGVALFVALKYDSSLFQCHRDLGSQIYLVSSSKASIIVRGIASNILSGDVVFYLFATERSTLSTGFAHMRSMECQIQDPDNPVEKAGNRCLG